MKEVEFDLLHLQNDGVRRADPGPVIEADLSLQEARLTRSFPHRCLAQALLRLLRANPFVSSMSERHNLEYTHIKADAGY